MTLLHQLALLVPPLVQGLLLCGQLGVTIHLRRQLGLVLPLQPRQLRLPVSTILPSSSPRASGSLPHPLHASQWEYARLHASQWE